jgi:hypothetical protein
MLVEVQVQRLGMDQATNSPVVILKEREGDRILPIWIGPNEASAIAMHMAEMGFSRPLTHDLLVGVIDQLGGTLTQVAITRVEDNTYYAELEIRRGEEVVTVDARPSDSIALALRAGATIFTAEVLLDRIQVELEEAESAPETGAAAGGGTAPSDAEPGGGTRGGASRRGGMSAEELEEYLKKMNPEDFGRFNP